MRTTTGAGGMAMLVGVLAAGGVAVGVGVTSAHPVRAFTAVTWVLAGVVLIAVGAAGLAVEMHRLRRRAATDPLTGLPDRGEFTRLANRRLRRMPADGGEHTALVLVDIDRFKTVNDSIGHASGDQLLVEIAARLRRSVRDDDLVARWGGDEFVLLLSGIADPSVVRKRTAELAACLDGIGDTVGPRQAARQVTASVGAAVAPDEGIDVDGLLDVADRAMYAAKSRRQARLER